MKAEILEIGDRASVISFNDPYKTNVITIFGNPEYVERVYILDTFVGTEPMKTVKKAIHNGGCLGMPYFILISHADYDHYWGNSAFKDAVIIGHESCWSRIRDEAEETLVKHKDMIRGKAEILPPTLTFKESIRFPEDDLTFFHSPGHTLDSSSVYDGQGKILFVGDNIETPYPYVNHLNLDQYISSLEKYLELEWDWLVSGHDPVMKDDALIRSNLEYLKAFSDWSLDLDAMEADEHHIHLHNLENLSNELLARGVDEAIIDHYAKALEIAEAAAPDFAKFVPSLRRVAQS
jgi:glyoxylase-like metal-dependent hydrolase (beta-lactamase superfamily II)